MSDGEREYKKLVILYSELDEETILPSIKAWVEQHDDGVDSINIITVFEHKIDLFEFTYLGIAHGGRK